MFRLLLKVVHSVNVAYLKAMSNILTSTNSLQVLSGFESLASGGNYTTGVGFSKLD